VSIDELCRGDNLLFEADGIVRVPFLVKGRLVSPPAITRREAEAAFAAVDPRDSYARLAGPAGQLLREPVIDRASMRYTGEYLYQVLPAVDPVDLIETDYDRLVRGPYALTVDEIVAYLKLVTAALGESRSTLDRVAAIYRRISSLPDLYLDAAFATLAAGLDPGSAPGMIDNELAAWGIPGRRFLDGWVELPARIIPGLTPLLARSLAGGADGALPSASTPAIRAMPTRQLHITAGNAPQVPIVSALRMILTKSAGVVKSPSEATLPAALLALAAAAAAGDHPLTRNVSLVYWKGGDEAVESALFAPGAFDRIVVWGAPDAVTAVQSRALFTRVVAFNPRYGLSLIGREAFAGRIDEVAALAAQDVMINDQKACTASLVQYVEGTEEQVEAYATKLAEVLDHWDRLAPAFVPAATRGQLKRMRRGRYSRARWLAHTGESDPGSTVVIMPEEFDILEHPMCRLVVIRPVEQLRDALRYLHQGVSMVGVYPEERRLALRDAIAARGVSSVLPLGQCERLFAGGPQDGMMVLSELVDWKNG
jgi:hypothetical protein